MAYASVTVEGGLFPPDLLDRIATGDAEGQKATDFGMDGGRLADEIQAAFSDARVRWESFQRRLERSKESPTTITREDWMIPFLELLGFYDVQVQRASAEAGGETYFISHRWGDDPDAPPVHIVALDQELDRREAARRSPHALVQDYLNRADALWGIATNGRRLRLLRDSARLSKPTYLEFDLEGMVSGNLYSEFVLLYRLLHATRFPRDGAAAHDCLLERYYQQGIDEGSRVRDKLRDGVEEALKVLGTAFLEHPRSGELGARFDNGPVQLDASLYYRQLLRLVYRFLFLMVAEERRLVFPSDADTDLHAIYTRYYSIGRLRERAERYFAGDKNTDLWLGLRETFRLFRENETAHRLGLSALDGELFGPDACRDLERAICTNEALLTAVRHLSTFVDTERTGRSRRASGIRRRVNYAALDVEEFGSVYESLLDFHPQVTLDPPQFDLVTGSERKQTGSYYTPPELVRELIDSALVPVMEERLSAARTREDKQQALLGLRVCDPAAGSGHFLLAAARRIARELAKVRGGEDEPTPAEYRHALRDVIRHCIYAVDKNPLAVDLCKVALWMEGHNAGLPLSFLDHHVKCGDSLVGVLDLGVLEEGIPDEAFKPVARDDKASARWYRDRNRLERRGQVGMRLGDQHPEIPHALPEELRALSLQEERSPDDVHAKEDLYEQLRARESDWWKLKVVCDLWTYAFFACKPRMDGVPSPLVPTTDAIRKHLLTNSAHPELIGAAVGYSENHPFLHWPLEFPDVFESGGFDVIVGNPPFMGGTKISTAFGDAYRALLTSGYSPAGGTADLCAYFYRLAFRLLRQNGHLGMVATNTIGQGDTRQGGLEVILKQGGAIVFAHRFVKWQGVANVEVNLLSICKGEWKGDRELDGLTVAYISSRVDDEPEAEPMSIRQNEGKCYMGSKVDGAGFVLESGEATELLRADSRNRDCLFRYLGGENLNSRPDQSASRWIICFFDWPLARARDYPDLIRIVEERVKAFRDRTNDRFERENWWLFARFRPEMRQAISGMERVLLRAAVSDIHSMAFVPNGMIYAHSLYVFAFDDTYHFALLQSNVHEAWVRRNASTMRTDIRYTPTDCFDNFPFPQNPSSESRDRTCEVGEHYHEYRGQVMLTRRLGLTKTYNLFNTLECEDDDIARLRELHAEMDHAILACYGWQDIDPKHGFYENERGLTRYTISPDARREILRRLLELNLAISESERTGQPLREIAQPAAS